MESVLANSGAYLEYPAIPFKENCLAVGKSKIRENIANLKEKLLPF